MTAACDIGGGGGGGPAEVPLAPRPIVRPERIADAAVRGAKLYQEQGCRLCHGEAGKGGVDNANSETGGKINGLTLVQEGYTKEQLVEKIREGVQTVGKKDQAGPTPPLRMPAFGKWLPEDAVSDLAAYLFSLYPKDRAAEDDWDDDDSADEEDGGPDGAADEDSQNAEEREAGATAKRKARGGGDG